MLVLHILHKSNRRRYLITFIVWDALMIGVCIAMISIFSFAGVPSNCGGMTRQNCKSIDLLDSILSNTNNFRESWGCTQQPSARLHDRPLWSRDIRQLWGARYLLQYPHHRLQFLRDPSVRLLTSPSHYQTNTS